MEHEISGLQCDTDGCDYVNPDVKFDDYINWIDRPCPCCGGSLLTKADFDAVTRVVESFKFAKKMADEMEVLGINLGPTVSISAEFNGTGRVTFTQKELN